MLFRSTYYNNFNPEELPEVTSHIETIERMSDYFSNIYGPQHPFAPYILLPKVLIYLYAQEVKKSPEFRKFSVEQLFGSQTLEAAPEITIEHEEHISDPDESSIPAPERIFSILEEIKRESETLLDSLTIEESRLLADGKNFTPHDQALHDFFNTAHSGYSQMENYFPQYQEMMPAQYEKYGNFYDKSKQKMKSFVFSLAGILKIGRAHV